METIAQAGAHQPACQRLRRDQDVHASVDVYRSAGDRAAAEAEGGRGSGSRGLKACRSGGRVPRRRRAGQGTPFQIPCPSMQRQFSLTAVRALAICSPGRPVAFSTSCNHERCRPAFELCGLLQSAALSAACSATSHRELLAAHTTVLCMRRDCHTAQCLGIQWAIVEEGRRLRSVRKGSLLPGLSVLAPTLHCMHRK